MIKFCPICNIALTKTTNKIYYPSIINNVTFLCKHGSIHHYFCYNKRDDGIILQVSYHDYHTECNYITNELTISQNNNIIKYSEVEQFVPSFDCNNWMEKYWDNIKMLILFS